MATSVAFVVGGLVLVIFFTEQLIKGTVGAARGLGLSAFLVSTVFLGFDPENLAVGAVGSFERAGGIALGTILGSAMVAVTLALGVTAAIAPIRLTAAPRSVLVVPVAAVALLTLVSVDGHLSRLDGVILVAGYALAVVRLITLSRRGLDIEASGEVAKGLHQAEQLGKLRAVGMVVASLVMIVVASELLVEGATDLIDRYDLSQTFVGMTVLALAISIEELVREVRPAMQGRPEISIGNVVGSILAFFLLNAGIISLVHPIDVDEPTRRFFLPVAAGAVLVVSCLLLTRHIPRWAGLLLMGAYMGFVAGGYALYGARPT
ncbi:hypothetical protein [Iamia sp.]|uniref:sodium:calcium antiporter n=1 Tax=Iamia sp. TaxID=2722710 RepID=UPI002B7D72F6|nr:hypothetical protein [Iamia sp.]HXH58035.1 hypothetical protein [Iamia sp.]